MLDGFEPPPPLAGITLWTAAWAIFRSTVQVTGLKKHPRSATLVAMRGRRVAALVAVGLTAGLVAAAPAHAGVAVVTVTQAGDTSFRVPGGVTSVTVRAIGAAGGAGGGAGGRGAVVAGALAVTPGSVLTAFVGAGAGTAGSAAASLRGGNGGGASGLGLSGAALLIAGGGGGGGGGVFGGPGGDAGAAGGAGRSTVAAQNADGGGAGTTSDAGAGGAKPADGDGVAGQSGVAGAGGTGGSGSDTAGSGGGGGGGYRGGGGGGAAATGGPGGGGGGANFSSDASNVTVGTSTSTPQVQLTYIDEQAPTVTLAAREGATISGFAGTDSGDAGSVTLEFYEGETALGSPVATVSAGRGPDGAFSSAVPLLGDGTWTVRAVQLDIAGNIGVSGSQSFTVDRTAPGVQLTSPDGATGDAIPHFEGTLGTAPGDLTTVTLTLTAPGGATTTFPATAVKGGSFSADAPAALPDGTYTVVASQADELGHVGRSTLTFVIDTVAPVVTLTGPEADTSSATITGTAGTAVGDDATVALQVRPSSGAAIQVSAPVVAGTFAASVALVDGLYTVTAIQTDHAANAGSVTRTFRVTNPAPPPVVGALTPTPARAAPEPVVKKAAVLRVKSATATRRGRTITLKLRGSVAKPATGAVKVSVAGKRVTAKLAKGSWTVTLRITGAARKSLKVIVAYGGDSGFSAATAKRTVRVR